MADPANPDNPEGQQSSSPKQDLRQDELVDKLAPEASQQQPLTVLSGFLGRSPQAGHWRLYLTPALDEYVEIPEEDIVHSQSQGADQSALGGTTLWVRSGTQLQYTHITSLQVQAEFLQGAITTGFSASTAGALGARAPRIENYVLGSRHGCTLYCYTNYICYTDLCTLIPRCY